jgi:hypothetical protein
MKRDILYLILIYLFITISFFLIFIYLEDPCLCQGETLSPCLSKATAQGNGLEILKTRLESEILEYQKAHEVHKQ